VKPLDYPETVTGILSFDFDGTLHLPGEGEVLDPKFFDEIIRLREGGWIWAINTGRSLLAMLEGFKDAKFPFAPDYLIAREREIYAAGEEFGRWHRLEDWHERYMEDTALFFHDAAEFIGLVKNFVIEQTAAQWIEEEGDPAGIIASSLDEMEVIKSFVEQHRHMSELIGVLHNSIYMRFTHRNYHKGSSLQELARRSKVPTSQVFAIGDGHNDLDKLHPDVAGMIACVGNSEREVIDYVRSHDGFVAQQDGSRGAIEALRYFLA
jgi:HAD superfamily hydrolase (TIGR01484 family)